MLDFRRKSRGRLGQQQRHGRRLLLVTILLSGLLIVVIDKARQPGAWNWFERLTTPSGEGQDSTIDNRLDAVAPRNTLADSFVIPKEPRAEKTPDHGKYFPGVKPEWFAPIHDDTISSRGEQACSLALLDILQKTDLENLRKASMGRVAYAQLFRQPKEYRGRLVTVSGQVHAVYRVELSKNNYGIKAYYQVWLAPFENRTNPIVIYCLELPKGFPTGDKVREEAEITGFFLKRWAYQATDTVRTAPELLAKTLLWHKRPVMTPQSPGGIGSFLLIVVGTVLVAAVTAWLMYARTRSPRLVVPDRPPDLENIKLAEEESSREHTNE
jgi:hypothetical protein